MRNAMQRMSTALLEPAPASEQSASWAEAAYVLTVACVYQDEPARDWARQVCARVSPCAGQNAVRLTEWQVSALGEPGVLADAVAVAAAADVIVVAIQAASELPVHLCEWLVAWLRRRPRVAGALVALISRSEQFGAQAHRAQDYLRAVARASALDFFTEERELPAEPPASSRGSVLDEDDARSQGLSGIPEEPGPHYGFHYGING
jgi:hypothetical protein